MKILHAFDLVTPSGTSFLVNDLCNALTEKGQQVTWLSSDYHKEETTIKQVNYEQIMLHCSLNLGNYYYMPMLKNWAKEHIREYDVIHLHTARSYQNIVLAKYARWFGIPYIIDSHGSLPKWGTGLKPKLKTIYDAFNKDIIKADAVLAENQFGFLEYVDFGVSKDKIKIIMPPLNMKAYDDLPEKGIFRKEYGIDKPIVMFLGRINKIKGLEFLVRGFFKLSNTINAILVIVGNDDGYEYEIRHYINLFGGIEDKVIFTGFRGGKDKLSALLDANVVVQVSEYEQGAYAPLEAVLCGTPIVVSDNSGAGVDVAYLQAGLVCHWNDESDLYKKMKLAIESPQWLKDLTQKAGQTIRRELSLDNQIAKYINVYESLMPKEYPKFHPIISDIRSINDLR